MRAREIMMERQGYGGIERDVKGERRRERKKERERERKQGRERGREGRARKDTFLEKLKETILSSVHPR